MFYLLFVRAVICWQLDNNVFFNSYASYASVSMQRVYAYPWMMDAVVLIGTSVYFLHLYLDMYLCLCMHIFLSGLRSLSLLFLLFLCAYLF